MLLVIALMNYKVFETLQIIIIIFYIIQSSDKVFKGICEIHLMVAMSLLSFYVDTWLFFNFHWHVTTCDIYGSHVVLIMALNHL